MFHHSIMINRRLLREQSIFNKRNNHYLNTKKQTDTAAPSILSPVDNALTPCENEARLTSPNGIDELRLTPKQDAPIAHKKKKHVSFNKLASCVLIPATKEYHAAGLAPDIWFNDEDYAFFKKDFLFEIEYLKRLLLSEKPNEVFQIPELARLYSDRLLELKEYIMKAYPSEEQEYEVIGDVLDGSDSNYGPDAESARPQTPLGGLLPEQTENQADTEENNDQEDAANSFRPIC